LDVPNDAAAAYRCIFWISKLYYFKAEFTRIKSMARKKKFNEQPTHRPPLTDTEKMWFFAVAIRSPDVFEKASSILKDSHFTDNELWLALVWNVVCSLHKDGKGELPARKLILNRCKADLKLNPDAINPGDEKKINELLKMAFSLVEEDMNTQVALDAMRRFLEDRLVHQVCESMSLPQTPLELSTVFNQFAETAAAFSTLGTPSTFPIISAAELATGDYRVTYIVERLLVEGQFCVVGGPKKSLKTSLAILLAICIALGRPFFERFRVNGRRRVLVCTSEAGLGAVKSIARRICGSLGVELESIHDLAFCPNVPKLDEPSSWSEFTRVVKRYQPGVVVLDPFYRMFSGEGAENLFKMAVPLDLVDDYCRSAGITPILCHHLKSTRANPFSPADLDDLAFAGISEFARQWILVTRRESYEIGSGVHRMLLNIGGSAGHNSIWALDVDEGPFNPDDADDDGLYGRHWCTCLRTADEARADAQQQKAEANAAAEQQQLAADAARIEDVLRGCSEQLGTKTDLRDGSGISRKRFDAALAVLLQERRLMRAQVSKRNNRTYDAFAFGPGALNSCNGTHQDSASGCPCPVAVASGTGQGAI
jgi:hypothetical protein